MPIWVGSPEDVRHGDDAQRALAQTNDSRYYDPQLGIVKVDVRRWRYAQGYESRGWLSAWADQADDRSAEHAALFYGYKALKTDLGRVLEVGCGPFTQLKTILQGRTAKRVVLVDPLLIHYLKLQHCPYKDKKLAGVPAELRTMMGEQVADVAAFDTVVCINVLEHCLDALAVLHNIKRALKPGGVLVLGERTFDDFDPSQHYDVGHPIHIKRVVLEQYRRQFTLLYHKEDYFIGLK